jgi:hypothetical protein
LFDRKRRREQRESQLVRARLDKLESQTPPNQAIEHMEGTISTLLQRIESAQSARDATVVHLWHKVIDQEHDVTAVVQQLVSLCATLTDRLESQRREQQELLEVIRVVGQKLELPPSMATVIEISEPSPTSSPASEQGQIRLDDSEESDHDAPPRDEGWHAAQ